LLLLLLLLFLSLLLFCDYYYFIRFLYVLFGIVLTATLSFVFVDENV